MVLAVRVPGSGGSDQGRRWGRRRALQPRQHVEKDDRVLAAGARPRELWPADELLAEWPDTEWPEDSFDRSETFED
jgi:hypothetical protein